MLKAQSVRADPPQSPPADLKTSSDAAMAFSPNRAKALQQSRDALATWAYEEVAFRLISVTGSNLTPGMRLHVLEPARSVIAEWRQARAPFDRAIAPYMPAINAVRDLEQQIEKEERDKEDRLARAEHDLEQQPKYRNVSDTYVLEKAHFTKLREAHGNLDANMLAYNPLYWVLMLAIGGAEWLINYNVFYMFMGIPALAAGATLVMGVLLALAAHGHGTLFKQWSHYFGAQRRGIERYSEWRLLGLSTFALTVVLVAAGGSRYAAVMSTLAGQIAGNLAGADAAVQVHPLRDVLLSLLANVAAWAIGVFIAYLMHDADPVYMQATRQYERAEREYHRLRRDTEDEKRTITAQHGKRERDLRAAAETKATSVHLQHQVLLQVEKHEAAVIAAVAAQVSTNATTYHDVLAQAVIAKQGECRIRQGDKDISPYEFKLLQPMIGAAELRAMVD